MKHEELARRVVEGLERALAADGWDDAAWAVVWDGALSLVREGLASTGVQVVDVGRREREADEPLTELEHGWASTVVEVVDWCADNGIPHDIGSTGRGAAVFATFDGRPDAEVRAALKAAGFRWNKGSKRWEHKAFGQWGSSAKVAAWRAGERPAERKAAVGGGGEVPF